MTTPAQFVCVIGFEHVPPRGRSVRFEPGDTVVGIPAKVRDRLAKDGVIAPAAPLDGVDA